MLARSQRAEDYEFFEGPVNGTPQWGRLVYGFEIPLFDAYPLGFSVGN
jgi:hypothetical protein